MEHKKNKIVAIIIIILILLTIVLGVVYMTKQDDNNEGILGAIGSFPKDLPTGGGEGNGDDDLTNVDYIPNQDTGNIDTKKPRLEKIAEGPIAGAMSFLNEEIEMVRYVEKTTGTIKEINMDNDITVDLSKRVIQKIHDAYWEGTGEKVLIRYLEKENGLDIIKTYWTYAELVTDMDQVGGFLPDGIKEISVSGDGDKIIYICDNNCDELANENAFGISSNFDNTNRKQVFFSPLKQWNLQWPTEETLALTVKPSNNIEGSSYLYKVANERFNKVVGERPGLTTLYNTTGQRALIAESGSTYSLSIYDLYEETEKDITIKAIPEKCAWGNVDTSIVFCSVPKNFNSRGFPDNWYKGEIHFSDNIWEINTDSIGRTNLSLKLKEESGEDIDAVELFLGNNDKYLYFTNKNDGALWVYRMIQ